MSTSSRSPSGGFGVLSDDTFGDDELHQVHGVAIGVNDVTIGHLSGERKLWTADVLEEAAHTLTGKQIVVDHENRSARKVVGQVTDSHFEEGVGVVYQGVIDDEELAKKIEFNWLEVSPRIIHSAEMEEREELKIPKDIRFFDNLSIVSRGAAGSNEINLGEREEELSVEELRACFDTAPEDVVSEYQDVEQEELQPDLSRWLFDNPEGAQGAAESLGCSGYHEHTIEEETWYMPCNSHDTFLQNLSEADENELGEREEIEDEAEELQTDDEEKRRLAGQISSWSALTRSEALGLLESLDPNVPASVESFVTAIHRSFEDVEEEDAREMLDSLRPEPDNQSERGFFGIELEEIEMDEDELEDLIRGVVQEELSDVGGSLEQARSESEEDSESSDEEEELGEPEENGAETEPGDDTQSTTEARNLSGVFGLSSGTDE